MGNVGILKSQLFIVLVFVFSLGLITIAVASPPGEDELRDNYHKRMITRDRNPVSAPGTIRTRSGCDSANNDWESVAREPVDIYSVGVDTYFGRKAYFTTYYSLSAGKGNVFSRPLGDPTITTGPNQFALNRTNSATNYPEVNRTHEIVVVFRYKLTERLAPKIEYHYQQWDYKDYQTSPMTQYMGCVSPIPNGPPFKEPTGHSSFRYETASSPTAYGSQTNRALTFNREENMRKTNSWIAGIAVAGMVLAEIAFLSPPAKADTAEATYKAKCGMCHGADGKAETPTGKAMKVNDFASETVQKMSDADLTDAIAKGKGKMPAFKTLTADQVKDLVAYLRSFGKKK